MNFSAEELQSLAFYQNTYEQIGFWWMRKGYSERLGEKDVRVCRFCSKMKPEVSFSKKAHVVPQSLGNRGLISYYECDTCNEIFGGGIENDLGNWTKPARTMLRVHGQNGIPKLVGKGQSGWRIEGGAKGGLAISAHQDHMPHTVDEEKKAITFDLPRDPYTPAAVMKAFVRIGLTMMPAPELANFDDLMQWIKNPDHSVRTIGGSTIYQTMHPGPLPNDQVQASLLRRAKEEAPFPYMFLVLSFANQAYQIPLTSRDHDAHLQGLNITMPLFPTSTPLDRNTYGHPRTTPIDLSTTTEVRDEKMKIVMRYDHVEDMQSTKGDVGESNNG
ncbi:HNH endonuclease [Dyella dinghuensis]|uniref:HNH endonuclease n=1 Tax=Dyella dinghuensis TaxID=1920169 RepID=A0A3S0PZN2_9GAMM|nr:HNH endonuclease [Dyella dinghuensis]RUL65788.1 HNH endonuclease [Dyella dinghuensis]